MGDSAICQNDFVLAAVQKMWNSMSPESRAALERGRWQRSASGKPQLDSDRILMLIGKHNLWRHFPLLAQHYAPEGQKLSRRLVEALVMWDRLRGWCQLKLLSGEWVWELTEGKKKDEDRFLDFLDRHNLWPYFHALEANYIEYDQS